MTDCYSDHDPIYDTDDDINRGLGCPYLPYDPRDIFESSVDPFLTPFYTITNDNEPFPPPEYDHEEKKLIGRDPSCQQPPFPSHHDLGETMKHDITKKVHEEDDMLEVAIHRRFMSLIVDISIFWLEERIQWYKLHPSFPCSSMIFYTWSLYFPTSHPYDLAHVSLKYIS